MRDISSNILYYKALIGSIISPLILGIFFKVMWANDLTLTGFLIIYVLLGIVFLREVVIKSTKYRQVLYSGEYILIKKYFTEKSIEIPTTYIISIEERMYVYPKKSKGSYKMIYEYEGENHEIYFYKSLDLYSVSDLAGI